MRIITLTTDWGYNDFYIGKFKGRLYSKIANVNVVDITHGINKFNKADAALIVISACFDFPPHTIHIIDVASKENNVLVVYNEQYFICSDNKIPSLIFTNKNIKIYSLDKLAASLAIPFTFVALDLYIDVAKKIIDGISEDKIGERVDKFLMESRFSSPAKYQDHIECYALYIDGYRNAILNITKQEFDNFTQGNDFYIKVDSRTSIRDISTSYVKGKNLYDDTYPVLSVSSSGYMELALYESHYMDLIKTELLPSSMHLNINIYLGKPNR